VPASELPPRRRSFFRVKEYERRSEINGVQRKTTRPRAPLSHGYKSPSKDASALPRTCVCLCPRLATLRARGAWKILALGYSGLFFLAPPMLVGAASGEKAGPKVSYPAPPPRRGESRLPPEEKDGKKRGGISQRRREEGDLPPSFCAPFCISYLGKRGTKGVILTHCRQIGRGYK